MKNVEIILYISDQKRSRDFYTSLLKKTPLLDVPGMTEFELISGVKLGLMPENGIAKILGNTIPHPASGNGIPRCELYLHVDDPELMCAYAGKIGGKILDTVKDRDWGDRAGYISDPDGHVIAFAQKV